MLHDEGEVKIIGTHRRVGTRGTLVAEVSYVAMAEAILSFLHIRGEVLLVDLISHLKQFKMDGGVDANWLLLQVKQDLKQKGLVRCSVRNRCSYLKLVKTRLLKSEFGNKIMSK